MSTERHTIEIIIGPCSRSRVEDCMQDVQEMLDRVYPKLGAAVAVKFNSPASREDA